jgi:hypothetical protein
MKKTTLLLLMLLLLSAACTGGGTDPGAATATLDPQAQNTPITADATPTLASGVQETLPPPVVVEGETADPGQEAPPPAEPTPEGPTSPWPWPADVFGYGVQSHAVVGDPAFTMDVIANQLKMEWVKVQLEWPLVQPDPETFQWFFYDGVVDEAYRRGIRLMFSVVGAPAWTRAAGNENGPPDDYNQYATFLTQMLTRYAGKVHSVEVWNEQNLDREWTAPGGLSPENYVEFLSTARNAIKAHDPNIIVISGALAPTGPGDWVAWADDFEYMDRLLAAGMLQYADCVGAHHNGYNIPPNVSFDQTGALPEAATAVFRGPFDNPYHLWSFQTTIDTYAQKVQAIDPNKKLCVTEFGWASSEGYDSFPQGFEFVQDNTLEEQATYIVQAFQQMYNSGDVWMAYLFNYDFGNKGNGPTDDPVPYSIIDTNGAPRPAFFAVADMPKPR